MALSLDSNFSIYTHNTLVLQPIKPGLLVLLLSCFVATRDRVFSHRATWTLMKTIPLWKQGVARLSCSAARWQSAWDNCCLKQPSSAECRPSQRGGCRCQVSISSISTEAGTRALNTKANQSTHVEFANANDWLSTKLPEMLKVIQLNFYFKWISARNIRKKLIPNQLITE